MKERKYLFICEIYNKELKRIIMAKKRGEAAPVVDPRAEVPEGVAGEVSGAGVEACLSNSNQSSFGKMSEGGRNIASQAYEGLYKIPGVNRIVGKFEIAYNQFGADRNEKEADGLKNKIDDLNSDAESLDRAKAKAEAMIAKLKQQKMPGAESLQLGLKDFDKQKEKLSNKKNKVQTAFESRDNKMALYTNKRDMIADKLIDRYDEKLGPMEKELEKLKTQRDEEDFLIAITEAKHNGCALEFAKQEREIVELEESMLQGSISPKEIKRSLKEMVDGLADGRAKMRTEKENLAKRKHEINKNIAKAEMKADPYRNKKDEFKLVKERKLIRRNVPNRTTNAEVDGEQEIKSHPRTEIPAPARAVEARTEAEDEVEDTTEEQETVETANEQFTIERHVSGWNTFIERKYKGILPPKKGIDRKDFLQKIQKAYLFNDSQLSQKDFKNILGKYYTLRKLPKDSFDADVNQFFES